MVRIPRLVMVYVLPFFIISPSYAQQPFRGEENAAYQVFVKLIASHPEPEIRNRLRYLLNSGVVLYTFSERIDFANTILVDSHIVLLVNKNMLVDAAIPDSRKYITLYHEYIHIQQILQNTAPEYLFRQQPPQTLSRKQLADLFHAEYEAYYFVCQLIQRQNWKGHTGDPDMENLYGLYEKRGFAGVRKATALLLSQRPWLRNYNRDLLKLSRE